MYPILNERKADAGTIGGHYFHQDIWAARKILERHPSQHLDVGSRLDGFVAHLLVFMPVTVIDIRSLDSTVQGLQFVQDDATELLKFGDSSIDSISSLHAAEHFGLGRYSDPVDPQACFRFMRALQRVLCPGGRLYFSVPIGRERVEFNAHRVFAVRTILNTFAQLNLVSFSLVGDDGHFYSNVDPAGCEDSEYSCGLFEFTKPNSMGVSQ
jgi:SAM-dependent methyltransferase